MVALHNIVHLGTSPIVVATIDQLEGGGGPNQHDFLCIQ